MKNFHWFISFLLLLLLVLLLLCSEAAFGQIRVSQDLLLLQAFKSSADGEYRSLSSWEGTNPCAGSWRGVKCRNGRISGIFLDGASLVGDISSILQLPFLEILSLRRNKLGGNIGAINASRNPRLRFIFLSHNLFNGSLDISLPALVSLRLESNRFSGDLRGLALPNLRDFNVSGNEFSGEIPKNLSTFPESAFCSNLPSLCGYPLPPCPRSPAILLSRSSPSPVPSAVRPCTFDVLSKLRRLVVFSAVVGDAILVAVFLSTVAAICIWISTRNGRDRGSSENPRAPENNREEHRENEDSKRETAGLVCFEGGEDLKLDCLLKASAEVLGEGDAGGTYKAVLHDGTVVAVKRLDVSCFPSGKIFDQHIRLIAMVRHRNIVCLRAYYNAREEKLLIYDYLPNGSLGSLLQNGRGYGRGGRELDWNTRKKILTGAAKGLDFIHNFPARSPLVHSNFKPSNILIDAAGEACVSEWGLMQIARNFRRKSPYRQLGLAQSPETEESPATPAGWHRYRAPELLNGSKATQASDVYSFGMVLLEVVTDKEIGNGEAEEEVMKMVKIGMMCTKENPDERPSMSRVLRLIADL